MQDCTVLYKTQKLAESYRFMSLSSAFLIMEMHPRFGQSSSQIRWLSTVSPRDADYMYHSARTRCTPFLECVSCLTHEPPPPLLHWHLIRSSFSLGLAVHHLCTWFSNRLGHYHMLLMDLCVCACAHAPEPPATPAAVAMINERGCLKGLCAPLWLLFFNVVLDDDWKEHGHSVTKDLKVILKV